MICSAIAVLASSVTGIGWYGEPLKHRGAGGAPSEPQSRVRSHTSCTGWPMTLATFATRARPPSCWRSIAVRLIETTRAVRLRASGRPARVQDHPRGLAGVTISRVPFSAAAVL
jgi:hypothetical protein